MNDVKCSLSAAHIGLYAPALNVSTKASVPSRPRQAVPAWALGSGSRTLVLGWPWAGLCGAKKESRGNNAKPSHRIPPSSVGHFLPSLLFPSLPAGAALPHLPSWGGGPALSSSRAGAKGMNNVKLRGAGAEVRGVRGGKGQMVCELKQRVAKRDGRREMFYSSCTKGSWLLPTLL